MNNDTGLFYIFSKKFAEQVLDEYLDVMRLGNRSTKDNATFFVAFNAILQREFVARLSAYDRNAEEFYKKEVERFGKIFPETENS